MAFEKAIVRSLVEERQERAGRIQSITVDVSIHDTEVPQPLQAQFVLRGADLNRIINAPDFRGALLDWLKEQMASAHTAWLSEAPERPRQRSRSEIVDVLGTDTITEL